MADIGASVCTANKMLLVELIACHIDQGKLHGLLLFLLLTAEYFILMPLLLFGCERHSFSGCP